MGTNRFSVKEIKEENIVLEEEKDKKHGIIWIFFKKYGRMLNMILSLVALFVLLVGMSLSYDIFLKNAEEIHIIDEKEYLKFTSNDLDIGDLSPVDEDDLNDDHETIVTLKNISKYRNVEYLIVVSENEEESSIEPKDLMFSISDNGGNSYTTARALNSDTSEDLGKNDYIIYSGDLRGKGKINLKLRIWIPETGEDQNYLQGKIFKGKINIYYREV